MRSNPDVAEAVAQGLISAWDHFQQFGAAEGRSPAPWFDESFYLQQNPDVAAAIEQGLLGSASQHFVMYGQAEPRAVSPVIDLAKYVQANPDLSALTGQLTNSPLQHLLTYGASEGRNLGNGISLSDFAADPVFTQALSAGALNQLLARVENVAPFIPGFERPAGWAPAANTPIPVDFVPPAGSSLQLVVPPDVTVPADTVLPPTFNPVIPPPTPGGGGPTNQPIPIPDNKTDLITINGTDGNDTFTAATSASLKGASKEDGKPTAGLILDGKAGSDTLKATLDASVKHPDYAPTISNVENFELTAQGGVDDIGLMFTRVSDIQKITNKASTANLTVVDVRAPVVIEVKDMATARDFAVRYGNGVDLTPSDIGSSDRGNNGSQTINLENSTVNLLTISKLDANNKAADAGILHLEFNVTGKNSIASFHEQALGDMSLASGVRSIAVKGSGDLTLNLAEFKAQQKSVNHYALERVNTNLSEFDIETSLHLKLADISGGNKGDLGPSELVGRTKSIHTITLPDLPSIKGNITIDNLTIASTYGYQKNPVKNDVIDITSWGKNSIDELASVVKSIDITKGDSISGSLNYVNFELQIENGDNDFVLTFNNLVSENVYNTMLKALATVAIQDSLETTNDLVGLVTGGGSLVSSLDGTALVGKEFNETEVEFTNTAEGNDAAIIALVGLLVNEGTITGVPPGVV